jgi:hypothetical protein
MSAAIPTSASSQDVPPASSPPEIPRDSDPDPTPTVIATSELEIVAETNPDESVTSLPPAPRPQSPEQTLGLVHQPAKVESNTPDPAPALRSVPARPHPEFTVSLIERERPLPAVPPNATLAPPMEASLRSRVVSDPCAHRRSRRFDPPPAQPLDLPGSVIFRQRPATHPGYFDSPVRSLTRINRHSQVQVRPLAPALVAPCGCAVRFTTWPWSRASTTLPSRWVLG